MMQTVQKNISSTVLAHYTVCDLSPIAIQAAINLHRCTSVLMTGLTNASL